MNERSSDQSPPPVTSWLQNGFHRFLSGYLRRHFHAVAITREQRSESTISDQEPLIVYVNHPSWWDPLLAHFLNRQLFPNRQFYAPIDADALAQYRVFAKLGFFGVQSEVMAGASQFLKVSKRILTAPNTALWLTPEGRFADPRDHQAPMMPGLAHVCSKMQSGCVLPLAMEYVFWEERLPVCLVQQGDPIRIADVPQQSSSQDAKSHWNELLCSRLRESQIRLSQMAIARSSEPFENLLHGKKGAGVFYDTMRRLRSLASGRSVRVSHGDQFSDSTERTQP
ncbi:lysophospholipid acyltransferase family protein [Planctomycetes bacterium K23_9]|uniref:Phospholipid/glycerol acyltransferase domain-containing protein n=1 Tax=Stieleria marina TaxID=1930275 RepID=A0A517NXE5_9BACT|nr:hypothetical protein K239x_37900 [Planctomycetes bacterium K23_9]